MPSWKRPPGQITGDEIAVLLGTRKKRPVPEIAPRRARVRGSALTADGIVYTDAEREFMLAIDRWKRVSGRPHPGWGEVFNCALGLGYTRLRPPDAAEFALAMAAYRRERKRLFPTCCEALQVLASLGYRLATTEPAS